MVKKTVKKENINNWFETENLSLILWCAVFGMFGVHKFIQHKTWQGILFILLDLTIVGILITCLWAFIDLIILTTKRNNPVGNIICGLVFVLFSIVSNVYIYKNSIGPSEIIISKVINQNESVPAYSVKKPEQIRHKHIKHDKKENRVSVTAVSSSCSSNLNIENGLGVFAYHCDCDVGLSSGAKIHRTLQDSKKFDKMPDNDELNCSVICSDWCKDFSRTLK
ncbi:MAG: TM2 domain-containing protein [Alphaproteobacteria bacterium]|nr:TM2 domain-containing protein [Alphaproteobacteria bacterium]